MRITTIFAACFALAIGVLIGWTVNSIQNPTPVLPYPYSAPSNPDFVAYLPHTDQPHPSHPSPVAPVVDRGGPEFGKQTFKEVQAYLNEGETNKAITLLQTNHFRGRDETERLVRLAALLVVEDPSQAWSYLAEAASKDPANADIRTFKASLEETLHHNQSAQSSYITAIQNDTENPYRRELLADFYLRTEQYPQALEILQDSLSAPSLDSIWLKAWFWSHITRPTIHLGSAQEIPAGSLHDLAAYLFNLPLGILWDQQAFETLADHQSYATTRQETFWLQLLAALKAGEEEKALQLLNANPFQYVSWAPELEKGLKTLIHYRHAYNSSLNRTIVATSPLLEKIESPQQLLHALASLSETDPAHLSSAVPYQMQPYLLSQEAFAIPFLAVGWTEAALQLHALGKFPDTFPEWTTEAITQALKQNRDRKTALSFAQTQQSTASLSLLAAEIALEANEEQIAFNYLRALYTQKSASGQRAALLLAQFLFDHDNPQDAKKALQAQPALGKELAAQELLARIALAEKDLKKAYSIYLSIENESLEAKSFLARKAFVDKEWTRARQLTESLLKEYPNHPVLTGNLEKIIAEERGDP